MHLTSRILHILGVRAALVHAYQRYSPDVDSISTSAPAVHRSTGASATPVWVNSTGQVSHSQITCCMKTDGLPSTQHTQACIMALIAHIGITSCQAPSPRTTYTAISSQACPQTCGQDAGGPTWTFGTGELLGLAQALIGLVQAILQVMTLPTIALHFMMHGRRHAHQHPIVAPVTARKTKIHIEHASKRGSWRYTVEIYHEKTCGRAVMRSRRSKDC